MDRTATHVALLPMRTRLRLAQARRQRGLPQLYSLALVSQLLREQLDATDRQIQTLILRVAERDRVVFDVPATPEEIAAVLADIDMYLGESDIERLS